MLNSPAPDTKQYGQVFRHEAHFMYLGKQHSKHHTPLLPMLFELVLKHSTHIYLLEPDPIVIGITLQEGEQNPSCYYAAAPQFETIRMGTFVGSVAEGGSCNHRRICLTPHANGTHTECYGHISPDPQATIDRCFRPGLFLAALVSIKPYQKSNGECVVRLEDLQRAIDRLATSIKQPEAIIIRTLPNPPEKQQRNYSGTNPPYLEPALAAWCAQQDIEHLLVDLPSVDPEQDGGQLHAHRSFWQYPERPRKHATITELIYVPNEVADGFYALQIMLPFWTNDAVPSTPLLFRLKQFEQK